MSLTPARRATLVAALLLASLSTACGGDDDGGTGPSGRRLAIAPGQPDSQFVDPSTDVAVAPAVLVTDAAGQPVANVRVTFTPGSGAGTVTQGTPVTNAQGIATVGSWRAGAAEGRQTLVASVPGSSDQVTFVANAVSGGSDPCLRFGTLAIGGSASGALAQGDCEFDDGSFLDLYNVTTTGALNHEIRMSSGNIDTFLWLWEPDGSIVGLNDDSYETDAAIRIIGPAESLVLGANSYEAQDAGTYTITTSSGARPAGCVTNTFLRPGASFTEAIANTDCEAFEAGAGSWEDAYYVFLDNGAGVTLTYASTAFDPYLRVYARTSSTAVAADDNSGGGTTARLTVRNTSGQRDYFIVVPTTRAAGGVGAYTMQVATASAALVAKASAEPAWWEERFARMAAPRGTAGTWRR